MSMETRRYEICEKSIIDNKIIIRYFHKRCKTDKKLYFFCFFNEKINNNCLFSNQTQIFMSQIQEEVPSFRYLQIDVFIQDFVIFYFKIEMFVDTTFLNTLDRLSVQSTLTGKTGTLCGVIGTLGLICSIVMMYLWPVINYFQGDYIQGTYLTQKHEDLDLSTGDNFKLSIAFEEKTTGKVVDHLSLRQYIKTNIYYLSATNTAYYSNVVECYDNYFSQMDIKPENTNYKDCYISPNGLSFKSQSYQQYLSVFGFKMDPICRDPLACTFNSSVNAAANAYRLQFFSNHYYVVRFTSSYLDDSGNLRKKFYQTYSSEWQARESIIPIMYTLFQTAKVYMDDSIMPWINNETILFPQWMGVTSGLTTTSSSLQNSGFGTYFSIEDNQRVYTREYKKLDWLLGILGGGMVFLYIIFYVPFNFMATLKQKYQTCLSTVMVRHDKQSFYSLDNAFKPTFNNPVWWITRLFQLDLKIFKQQNRSMECSQKLLDICELIKKIKIAKKNLSRSNQLSFQPVTPEFNDQTNRQFSEEQKRSEIRQDVVNQIINKPEIGDTLNNYLPLLALLNKYDQQNSSKLKLRMNAIMSNQTYSKYKVPDLANERKNCCVRIVQCFLKYFSKIISFFDVFGAKPNLSATPENYSIFGCILTLIIIILSILTFAMTIRNMNVQRTYWDNIYENPQNKNINLITGKNFRMALCFPYSAISSYLITNMSRKVNVQFYQYTRENMIQSYQYYQTIIVTSDPDGVDYFDMTSESYNIFDFSNCLKPENNIDIKIYGDSHSQNQAYIGFRITPFCPGIPSSCNAATINNDFFNILNQYKINILASQSKYFPDLGKVQQNPVPQDIITSMQSNTLHLNKSIYQELYLQTLQIIDHYGNWFMSRSYPPPKETYLNLDFQSYQSHIVSADTPDPQYKLKVLLSGKVSRVIFSSYKVDFLFAMIGGCFAFYFIILGCIGKAYNRYNLKRKLAQTLYDEQYVDITVFKAICQSLGLPFCGAPLLSKIQKSIDCVTLAKNVDNVYRLSVATYNNALEKDLALIYLKERIKEDQQIELKKLGENQVNKDDESIDREFVIQRNQQILTDNQLNNSQHTILNSQKQVQVQYVNQQNSLPSGPTVRKLEKCSKLVNNFDIFANDPQLTLDGKRSVKSVCGGFCFIILTIFICVLTYHFLTIYFYQIPRVSINKIVEQNSENLKMNFKVGENMKLALSFYKADDFSYFNVYNITTDVGLALMKYRVQRLNASFQTTSQTVPLEPCSRTYLNNFNTSHDSIHLLNNLDKAFCVPDGTSLSIYGSPQDKVRQYFSLKIYNKQSINSTSSNQTIYLLNNYLVRYHISSPIVDFSVGGGQHFSMTDIAKTDSYQVSTSKIFNITMTKNQISYDTAMYATNQRPSFTSYELHTFKLDQFSSSYSDSTDRLRELNFVGQNLYNKYTVKTIKVYQVFGIIGGCIAFLFFGFGCFPRSFNQYKMKYMIGSKLYTILGKKKKKESKNVRGKKQKISKYRSQLDLTQFSDWRLLLAWFLSHISFFTRNFNLHQSLRHVALLESRVGRDINIFQLMKDLYACESAIRQLNLSTINLSQVNFKQIISLQNYDEEKQKQLIDQIRNYNTDLEDAARINKFTFWELKIILTCKQKGIDFSSIFKQKWLDRFVGIDRSTVGTRTEISSSLSSYNQEGSVTSQNQTQSQRPVTEDNQSIDDKEVKPKKPNLKEIQEGQDEEQSQNEFEQKKINRGNLKINEKQEDQEQKYGNEIEKNSKKQSQEKKENTNTRLQFIHRDNSVQYEDQVDLEKVN